LGRLNRRGYTKRKSENGNGKQKAIGTKKQLSSQERMPKRDGTWRDPKRCGGDGFRTSPQGSLERGEAKGRPRGLKREVFGDKPIKRTIRGMAPKKQATVAQEHNPVGEGCASTK